MRLTDHFIRFVYYDHVTGRKYDRFDYVNYLETTNKWGISGGVHFLNISLIESSWAWGLKGNIVSPRPFKRKF